MDQSDQEKLKDFVSRFHYDSCHLLDQLKQSRCLLTNSRNLSHNFFNINGIEKPKDPALFFNKKLINHATSFMKKIQQDLIEICDYLDVSFLDKVAVTKEAYEEFIQQGSNFYISQSSNLATIKCSNRNIFVSIDALRRSEYFRFK